MLNHKIKLLALILFIILYKKASCQLLKVNSFCILKEKTYKDSVCKNYQCLSDVCSIDKASCEKFKDWSELLDRYKNYDFIDRRIKMYQNFVLELKTCRIDENVSLKSEICLNKRKPYDYKKWSPLLSKGVIHIKSKFDSCKRHKFTFKCGEMYCTRRQETCDLISNSKNYILKNLDFCS